MSEEVKTEGTFKVKKKPGRPKKLNKSDEVVKLDLTKKEEFPLSTKDKNGFDKLSKEI